MGCHGSSFVHRSLVHQRIWQVFVKGGTRVSIEVIIPS